MYFLNTLFLVFFTSLSLWAQTTFEVPPLTGPVMDQVGYLTRGDRQELMQLLYEFNKRGTAQVQVLIVPDLQGIPIEQASIQITDKWKLGDKTKDNGVLFLISAKDRKMRLEIGQGLEGAIPDVVAKRIISDQVTPLFRAKRYSAGIVLGVHEILRLADQEFASKNNLKEEEPKSGGMSLLVIMVLFIVVSILSRFGGGRGHHLGGGGWGGGYGGGGGWPSGGGGGGGWSGGGGGFSGGGASGDW